MSSFVYVYTLCFLSPIVVLAWDSRLAICRRHPQRHGIVDAGEAPGRQDDKGVVDADAEHEEGGRQVDADEVHPDVHAEPEGGEWGEDGGHHTQQTCTV